MSMLKAVRNTWAADHHGLPGKLIAVCGFDGAGKTTQICLLAEACRAYSTTVVTKQPTDEYRSLPVVRRFLEHGGSTAHARVLSLLSAADRLKQQDSLILPSLRRGATVITDRYLYSAFAYFQERGVPLDFLSTVNSGVIRPDFAVYLRVPPDVLWSRIRHRYDQSVKLEEREIDTIARVTTNFEAMAGEFTVVDGTQTPTAVHEAIVKIARDVGAIT